MKIRADVAELLRAGLPDDAIVRQLHVANKTVSRARRALRIPNRPGGRRRAASVEELFWQRTARTEDGHLEWTGHRTKRSVPAVRYGGHLHSAYRIAFRIRHGRDPQGQARPECGHKGCVNPEHVTDRLTRHRDTAAFDAIFGALPGADNPEPSQGT